MSNTRTSVSPGVFADDALTTIPPTPVLGTAYRDTTTSQADSEAGWPYGTKVDSETFNQIMHEVTALLKIIDTQGILGWSNAVDYPAGGAYALGSDGALYRSVLASGPSGAGAQDPVSAAAYWVRFGASAASAGEVVAGTEAAKFVSPATLGAGLLNALGGGSLGASGWVGIPFNLAGVKRTLIVQWGGGSAGSGAFIAFPTPFPNAVFRVVGSDSNGPNIFGYQGASTTGFSLRTNTGSLTFDYLAIGW